MTYTIDQLTEEQAVTAMETIGDSDMPGLFKLIAVFVDYDHTFPGDNRKARRIATTLNEAESRHDARSNRR